MKQLLTTLILLLSTATLSAQIFEISPWGSDEVECKPAVKNKDGEWMVIYNPKEYLHFKEGFRFESLGQHERQQIFAHEGRYYAVRNNELRFSSENPDEVENPLSEKTQERDSLAGCFYGSMSAVVTILLVMAFATLVSFGYYKGIIKDKKFVLRVIPAAILINSLIITLGYMRFGSDIFWWCDYDRYGFFGSLFRVIPFILALLVQVGSIKFYELFLFDGQTEREDGTELKLSIKPAAISIAVCLPITIASALIMASIGLNGTFLMDLIAVVIFFGSLGWGMITTYRKNVKLFGSFNGLMMTIFSTIYIIGCLISVVAIITLIIQLIIQVLMVLGAIFVLMMVAPKRRFRGSDGRIYEEY